MLADADFARRICAIICAIVRRQCIKLAESISSVPSVFYKFHGLIIRRTPQKPGDNDGEANRKPALSFPRSPISPCITVTQMSNQASALNTEVPVSCFLSSPAPRLWLIVLPKRLISREHPFLEVMMQTWARGIKARAYHLYPFTRKVSTLTASQLAYDSYHKKEFVFSRNCNKMAKPSPVR